MERDLIAPCGMNCGLCISYQAMKLDLNKHGFKRSYCPGCRTRGKNCLHMRGKCDLVGSGLVHFCSECNSFPCKRLQSLDKRYRTKYHLSMIDNLKAIESAGLEYFLEQEALKWRCPECGGAICCHNGLCLACDLDTLRRNRKYRWGEE